MKDYSPFCWCWRTAFKGQKIVPKIFFAVENVQQSSDFVYIFVDHGFSSILLLVFWFCILFGEETFQSVISSKL